MKLKDYIDKLPENIHIKGERGLTGKELRILEPYLHNIEEFIFKKVNIIDELNVIGEPQIIITDTGVEFITDIEPKLIVTKELDKLKHNIEIYSVFNKNNDTFVVCTEDSII